MEKRLRMAMNPLPFRNSSLHGGRLRGLPRNVWKQRIVTRMQVLLTGFEPFGGEALNSSWEVARRLDGIELGHVRVQSAQLPCRFGECQRALADLIGQIQPIAVLALGQAASRHELSVERVAINVDDARIADNAGLQPIDSAVIEGAPAAYFSTLPIKRIVAALRAAGLPAAVSQSAGTFVCNHLFFALQDQLAGKRIPSGFLHLPSLPSQSGLHNISDLGHTIVAKSSPSPIVLSLEQMMAGVRIALEVIVGVGMDNGPDLQLAAGAID